MAWEWEERTEQSLNLTNSTIFSNSSILNYDYDNTLDNSNPSQNATASSEADQVYAISNAVSIVFIIIVVLVIFFWRRYQRNKVHYLHTLTHNFVNSCRKNYFRKN